MRLPAHHFWRNVMLLVALLSAVMPTAAKLSLASGQGAWQLVCAANGSRWVQLDTADTQGTHPQSDEQGVMLDCPLCVLGARALYLPPQEVKITTAEWFVRYLVTPAPAESKGLTYGVHYLVAPPLRAPPTPAQFA